MDELDATLSEIDESFKDGADNDAFFSKLEEATERFLRTTVRRADQAAVVARIRQRRANLSLSSDINTEIVGVCKQVLAFGAAGTALTAGFGDKIKSLPVALQKAVAIGGITYLELTLTALLVLGFYLLQARFRYPFLQAQKIGNAWPYFYYASISRDVPRFPIQTRQAVRVGAKLYAQDLTRFANKVVSEDPQDELRNELQQYFLLIAYQGYVHQFSLRLTNLFIYALVGTGASCAALVVWATFT